MKYIRTKDIIIEINPTLTDEQIDISLGKNTPRADTIEELCDEFVAVTKDNKYRSLVKIEETGNRWVEDKITQWCEILKDKLVNWDIYGAIWTDKGLIYVAKMNDKGELELL